MIYNGKIKRFLFNIIFNSNEKDYLKNLIEQDENSFTWSKIRDVSEEEKIINSNLKKLWEP
jgi:hypothetical protein